MSEKLHLTKQLVEAQPHNWLVTQVLMLQAKLTEQELDEKAERKRLCDLVGKHVSEIGRLRDEHTRLTKDADFWKDKAGEVADGTVQLGHSLGDANGGNDEHKETIRALNMDVLNLKNALATAKRAEEFWHEKTDTMAADRARITNENAAYKDENAALIKALNITGAILGTGQCYGIKQLIDLAKGEDHD